MIRLTEPQFDERELEAVRQVFDTGMLVQGQRVREFESAVEAFLRVESARAVSSGTAALHLALLSLGIGPGDAVLVPAFTFPAPANVVEMIGARPVLVDVDLTTYCISADLLNEAVERWSGPEKMRAVVPVHEFGAPCPMGEIMQVCNEHSLAVIEDAACAFGSKYGDRYLGTIGDVGCFSLHPRKAITTGEGGMIVSSDPTIAQRVECYRNHGIERTDDGSIDFAAAGLNYRLTEFQAAIGLRQLGKFEGQLKTRLHLVELYHETLREVPCLNLPAQISGHTWQTFMVVLPERVDRRAIIEQLKALGIESNLGAYGVHMLDYYSRKYGYVASDYPGAAALYARGLALPLHAGMLDADVRKVCEALVGSIV